MRNSPMLRRLGKKPISITDVFFDDATLATIFEGLDLIIQESKRKRGHENEQKTRKKRSHGRHVGG